MTFEEFVRNSIDIGDGVIEQNIHAQTTENMLKCIAKYGISINRTFIYNYDMPQKVSKEGYTKTSRYFPQIQELRNQLH